MQKTFIYAIVDFRRYMGYFNATYFLLIKNNKINHHLIFFIFHTPVIF